MAIGTVIMGIAVLKNSVEFKYGDDVGGIVIGLFYLIPIIFIGLNGIILKERIEKLRNNTAYSRVGKGKSHP